jgi:hypothetical protein
VNGRLLLAMAGAILLALAIAYWAYVPAGGTPGPEADAADGPPVQTAIEGRLVPVVEAARAAAAQAAADGAAADAIAARAGEVADTAARFAAEGRAAAESARAAAAKACTSPGRRQGCASAGDGTRYEGEQSCRADGCGPDGFGVFTDSKRGWESQGRWQNWSLVLGCDTMKGAITYCGQQVGSAWSGFGISYNENAAAISAEWLNGVGTNPIQLDYPGGSRMRGDMADYELNGPGVYERSDGRILRGRWRAGTLLSGVVAYPKSGDVVSGAFLDGNAQSGSIRYRDGRVFVGDIEDGPELMQARPKDGVLYGPDGTVELQGVWRNGMLIAQ